MQNLTRTLMDEGYTEEQALRLRYNAMAEANEAFSTPASDTFEVNRVDQCNDIRVDQDFIKTVQNAAKVIVMAAAELQNSVRLIERHHPHAGDALIVGTLGDIKTVAGDLSETWSELNAWMESGRQGGAA